MKKFTLPGHGRGFMCSNPAQETTILLLGSAMHVGGVHLPKGEAKELATAYGYDLDFTSKEGVEELEQAGAARNLGREVARDGARIMALLAPYLEKGQDPVKLVTQLLVNSDYEVPGDLHMWAWDGEED